MTIFFIPDCCYIFLFEILVCCYVALNASASLLGRGDNVLELGAKTNDGVTEHTRIDLETLVELVDHSWVRIELH